MVIVIYINTQLYSNIIATVSINTFYSVKLTFETTPLIFYSKYFKINYRKPFRIFLSSCHNNVTKICRDELLTWKNTSLK